MYSFRYYIHNTEMDLKLPLKNGSHLLKSQEPSPSPQPSLLLIPFYGLIIYAINSPFHFMDMESPEILNPNDRHTPCTPRMQHDEPPTRLGSLHHVPTWLQNLGSYKNEYQTFRFDATRSFVRSLCIPKKSYQISHANRSPVTYQKWSRNTVNLFLPLQHQPLVHL